MLDLSSCKVLVNDYAGAGKKKKIIFNDEIYMLKFPNPVRGKKLNMPYANHQYSEHIGCCIAKSLGLNAQDTFLATFVENGKTKVCVACRDFANDGLRLCEFSSVINGITSSDDKYSTNIEDVYSVIDRFDFVEDKQKIIDGFWDIFVLDAIIGNKDRHLSNWGVVEDSLGEVSIAPVYDCGSCLFPLSSEDEMKELYYNATKLKSVSYTIASAYKLNGKRLFYYDIPHLDIPDLKRAIVKVGSNFDLDKAKKIVYDIPSLSKEYKEVCLKSMEIRYNHFIKDLIMEKDQVLKTRKEISKAKKTTPIMENDFEPEEEHIDDIGRTLEEQKEVDNRRLLDQLNQLEMDYDRSYSGFNSKWNSIEKGKEFEDEEEQDLGRER